MTDRSKPRLEVVAPVFPVTDLKRSVAYFVEKLMFETGFEWADHEDGPVRYAILNSGDCELHLSETENPSNTVAYFFVHGVREYYDVVKENGATIRNDIKDYPWEMREFETVDPDNNILIFGEHLSRIDGKTSN